MKLSALLKILVHLMWAILVNFLLKYLHFTTDKNTISLVDSNEFVLIYFVVLSTYYSNTIDKFYEALILNPMATSMKMLEIGLKHQLTILKGLKNDTKK